MKTKTPKQIAEQFDRIFDKCLCITRPGYEVPDEIVKHYRTMTEKAKTACFRYIDNIYKANGFVLNSAGIAINGTIEQRNDIFRYAATPRVIYAGY